MSETKKKKVGQVQIQVDDDVAQGVYASMAMVHAAEAEFTIDFIYVQPQSPRAKVRSRVVTSPKHLKRLVQALQDSLERHEATHGPLDPGTPPPEGEFRH